MKISLLLAAVAALPLAAQSAPSSSPASVHASPQVVTVPAFRDHGTLDLHWFAFSAPPQFRRLEWCNYLWTAKKEVKISERAVMTARWE